MSVTHEELKAAIGQQVLIVRGDLQFVAVVMETKISYGTPRFRVRPQCGFGTQWVELDGKNIKPMPKTLGTNNTRLVEDTQSITRY